MGLEVTEGGGLPHYQTKNLWGSRWDLQLLIVEDTGLMQELIGL